jgi:hypothetical protein
MGDEVGAQQSRPSAAFEAEYVRSMIRHAADPTEFGLEAAYGLGRRALGEGVSMLQLVAVHLRERAGLLQERGLGSLPALDAFLTEALAAYEMTQRGYQESQLRARASRERTEILGALQALASELARLRTGRRVAEVVLRRMIEHSGASGGWFLTGGRSRRSAALLASRRLPDPGAAADELFRAARDRVEPGEAIDVDDAPMPPALRAALRRREVETLRLYPVLAGRRQIGAVFLAWTEDGGPPSGDGLLPSILDLAGPALERAERYDVEHEIAQTLQRSILDVPEVGIAGLRWAAHYRPGSPGLAGGDWYDVIPLDHDMVAVAVGDIVGQGVRAAAAMGQVRSATRALARHLNDPGLILDAVSAFCSSAGRGEFSSLGLVVFDPSRSEICHALAGHPSPIVRAPDGTVRQLTSPGGALLGVADGRRTERSPAPHGTAVVMYTDGLVERRGESLDVGIERLTHAVADAPDVEPHALAAHVLRELGLDGTGVEDDIALVVVLVGGEAIPVSAAG